MKNLILLAALLAASCAYPVGTCPDATPKKFGSLEVAGNQCSWMTHLPVVGGVSAHNIIFSTTSQGDTNRGMYPGLQRVVVRYRGDQATTVFFQTLAPLPATTWRTLNGSGSGDSVTANTDYAKDFLVLGPDVRVDVLTGGTPPTGGGELAIEICNDRTLGM